MGRGRKGKLRHTRARADADAHVHKKGRCVRTTHRVLSLVELGEALGRVAVHVLLVQVYPELDQPRRQPWVSPNSRIVQRCLPVDIRHLHMRAHTLP